MTSDTLWQRQRISKPQQTNYLSRNRQMTPKYVQSLHERAKNEPTIHIQVTPKQYLSFMRAKKDQMQQQYLAILQAHTKSRCVVDKMQKDAAVSVSQNIKLYANKKFQLQQTKLRQDLFSLRQQKSLHLKNLVKERLTESSLSVLDCKKSQEIKHKQQFTTSFKHNLSQSLQQTNNKQWLRRSRLTSMMRQEKYRLCAEKERYNRAVAKLAQNNHKQKLNKQKMLIQLLGANIHQFRCG